MEKLKSMIAYILQLGETSTFDTDQGDWYCKELDKLNKIRLFANFLSQTLNISMFVPSKLDDGKWVVLEEPSHYGKSIETTRETLQEYETAKSNVLFEDCSYNEKYRILTISGKTITLEYLKFLTIERITEFKPTLATTAKKQIGL